MRRRRPHHIEPVRCVCQPGADAHQQHGKPGAKGVKHLDARCPHSTLIDTTKPLPTPKKRRNLRLT